MMMILTKAMNDGKLLADQVVRQKPTNATAVEGINEDEDDDDDDYNDDRGDGEQTGDDDEEDCDATATSHEDSKTKRRLYDDDVEDVQRRKSRRKENGDSTVVAHLDVPIRGMSKSESKRNQQEFATQRIKAFVTTKVFRKIKFMSNDEMLREEAMDWVMDREKVPGAKRSFGV